MPSGNPALDSKRRNICERFFRCFLKWLLWRSARKQAAAAAAAEQGCQMVCFRTKNPNSGKFCRVLDWKMFVYFITIWNISWRFEIFYENLVHSYTFGTFFPVLVSCTKINLATLLQRLLPSNKATNACLRESS
jgi:hypothetical protein